MDIRRINASRRIAAPRAAGSSQGIRELGPPPPGVVSRRQFVRNSAGAVIAGAALGSGILRPSIAHALATSDPVPIPGGSPALGGAFHIYAPGPGGFDSIGAEPITITDFNGFVGLAYVSGSVTRRNRSTGAVDEFPYLGADMRFMQGTYRAQDGRLRRGAFGFV